MKENSKLSVSDTKGILYVCASPIGYLADVSTHLRDCLAEVDVIFCEDTRHTKILCNAYDITTPLYALDKFKEAARVKDVQVYLEQGKNVAYLSDAGTPAICDPGAYLVQQLVQSGYCVKPVSGPSAVTTFLSAAGLYIDQFLFAGFFPRKESEQRAILEKSVDTCLVVYESPRRLLASCQFIKTHYEIDSFVAAKELSKTFEQFFYSMDALLSYLDEDPVHIKGEWVFSVKIRPSVLDLPIETVQRLKSAGFSFKDTVSCAKALSGVNKKSLFEAYHD